MEFTMMIRLASAAAIAALMSTTAMAQSPNAPMAQPAPRAPMTQSAPREMGPPARLMTAVPANGTTVTNYYKQSVYDTTGNKVGDVSDLIVDKDGRITAAIVGVGGFLGMDEKNVAISFDALRASQKSNVWRLTVNTTKDALKRAPGFKYDSATTTWMSAKSAGNADHKAPRLADTKRPRK
jgi:sporulation protein YlmC with PRC-barrel domain